MTGAVKYHIHREPGCEVQSPAGYYIVKEEHIAELEGGALLYVLAEAISGSACCGAGTLRYIVVSGWIRDRAVATDGDGNAVSTFVPVDRDKESNKIIDFLSNKYPALQVCFW
ncbi:MAG: hypothetical protein CVV44_01085 [Spirochaetae bacterium HGW-Spirochaetae-1]|nr:MAG: hypothetical protein CVV44_01085 [Spirochaetae bacterium HGW-Spirochaetae-1]